MTPMVITTPPANPLDCNLIPLGQWLKEIPVTLLKTNIAMESSLFWWYLLGKMGIFMGYVSFREGTMIFCCDFFVRQALFGRFALLKPPSAVCPGNDDGSWHPFCAYGLSEVVECEYLGGDSPCFILPSQVEPHQHPWKNKGFGVLAT